MSSKELQVQIDRLHNASCVFEKFFLIFAIEKVEAHIATIPSKNVSKFQFLKREGKLLSLIPSKLSFDRLLKCKVR